MQKVDLYLMTVQAGFPSPASDYADEQLDFNHLLIKRPSATYCLRVAGRSMEKAGILPDDILVVDRSVTPRSGDIVVASLDGEFTVKRFINSGQSCYLKAEADGYQDIGLDDVQDFSLFGVVSAVVRQIQRKSL